MKQKPAQLRSPVSVPQASPINHWAAQARVSGVGPQRGYVICATPRTGSYFLCDLLRSTGCLGRPHEYFDGPAMRRRGAADYPLDLEGQIAAALTDGCSANGIHGAKLFPDQFAPHSSRIMESLGQPVPVFLRREDLLGQAISFSRAAQTKAFFALDPEPTVLRFDAALVRDYLELIVRWNAEWEIYFARQGLTPLRLSYEQLLADPKTAIAGIATALGLSETATVQPDLLTTQIQRDSISEQWREQFLAAQPDDLHLETLRSKSRITWQRRLRRAVRLLNPHRDQPVQALSR